MAPTLAEWKCHNLSGDTIFKVRGNIGKCFYKIIIPQTHNALSIYMTDIRFTSAKLIYFSFFQSIFLLSILNSLTDDDLVSVGNFLILFFQHIWRQGRIS